MMAKSSPVAAWTSSEPLLMHCGVCMEEFDLDASLPKILSCTHTCCLSCMVSLFNNSQQVVMGARKLVCPFCRETYKITLDEIIRLPTDHRVLRKLVVQKLKTLSTRKVKSQNVCVNHKNTPLDYFCQSCEVPVCRLCILHTNMDVSEGHDVIDIQQALAEYLPLFAESELIFRERLENLKEKSFEEACEQLRTVEHEEQIKLEETFEEYHRMLDQRQHSLSSQLAEEFEKQRTKIRHYYDGVSSASSDMEDWFDEFEWARKNLRISELFISFKKIKKWENILGKYTCEDNVFPVFEPKNEDVFISDLIKLGRIRRRCR